MKDHLDIFNHIILDLQGVEVKIDDGDQYLILLCSLPGKKIINDVNDSLLSKELK